MTSLIDRKKSRNNIGLKKDLSLFSDIIKTNKTQKNTESKISKEKHNKPIINHKYNFKTSKNLGELSSFDTLEKKKSSKKKKKISFSERIVTNFIYKKKK